MTTLSDLSMDLVWEIFSRVPLTSLNAVRSSCKTWNALSKTLVLGQGAVEKQFRAFTVRDFRICVLRFELQGIRNEDYDYDNLAEPYLKEISIPHHRQVDICQVFHCDGILLCVLNDLKKLLVWNPYLGQTRWLLPRPRPITSFYSSSEMYDIGYEDDNNNRNHKILRFSRYYNKVGKKSYLIDVFDFRSASWRVLHVNPILGVDLRDLFGDRNSVSLKGNTYFCVREGRKNCLLCFDFTTERFGPCLPLPQPYANEVTCVRDEKIALLCNHYKTSDTIVIWITTKIESNAVSWTKFLTLDTNDLPADHFIFPNGRSFFIDEDKKVAVVFHIAPWTGLNQVAYIIGEDGYFRSVNMREAQYKWLKFGRFVCCSYVPSLVQVQV